MNVALPKSRDLKDECLIAEGIFGVITAVNSDGVLGIRFNRYTSPNRLGWVKTDFLGMVALCEVNSVIALVIESSADVGSTILAVFAKGDREKALDALDRLLGSVYEQCDFSNDKNWR